ncbi:aryl-alcohol dehydrogenase [Mycena rosella]|uniref:Aryl-alcohol dehydrogenase n=1 Tax=Mycena rosella TaxID=1033263 RepID=A0AAD7G5J1_MYCRO|nr:aryl-alcohol dehydrogenase [Mycena rosella]
MSDPLPAPRRVKYVRLGNSGLKVSQIILGCMSYGSKQWAPWVLDEEEATKHIKFAYDAGIQTFDTANIYSNGLSEVVLGNAIKTLQLPREEIVVMTKVSGAVGKTPGTSSMELFMAGPDNVGYVNQHGLSRKHIFDSVKASLTRLQLEYIDVLQVHRFDYGTPVSETMHALHDVVQAGYVRYIGMSSCYAWQYYALTHNLTAFISMQNQYSLAHREEEREMLPTLKHFGVGSIPWSPLARGALARPYSVPDATMNTARQGSDEIAPDATSSSARGTRPVEEIAKKHNASMAQVALAWVMAKDEVSAPIVGTTSLDKLEDLIGAIDVTLSAEEMKYLEEPYTPMDVMAYW